MADEKPPPERDVNEPSTLGASGLTPDPDGPLAHLLSASPVADLGRPSDAPADDDLSSPSEGGLHRPADVGGLEDLFVSTTELPHDAPPAEPSPTAFVPHRTGPEEHDPVDPRPVEPNPVDLKPTEQPPTGPRLTRPEEPVPVRPDPAVDDDPLRSFEVGGNLRFSTEAGARSVGVRSASGQDQPYPAALVPNAVPAPVAPNKSVRVPGEERRRGTLPTALAEITERRWFWASTAGFVGLVVVGLLAASNIVPNPLVTDRSGVVADNRLPAAPAVDRGPETSEADTASSTGAGTGRPEPGDTSSSIESTTSSTSSTAGRRVVTTARATVRSTTPTRRTTQSSSTSSSTSTSVPSTTTTASSSTTASTTTSSSTTGSGSSTTTSTSEPTTTSESTTTTTGSSSSTNDSVDP